MAMLCAWLVAGPSSGAPAPAGAPQRPAEDEIVYFLLPDRFENGDPANDRGGLTGDRLATGFDPSHKGFFHGGDLKGLQSRLDYIQSLGATALWVAPVFRNKVVQGPAGQESAGYHGYWITDFTQVDPHFGSNADFASLVEAAHARGLKVYLDIVANHTADVINYRECPDNGCAYRRRIEPPYTAFVPAAEQSVKVPAWLNDTQYYHNRGNSTFRDESSLDGDFAGLDDLMTEHPAVVQGLIDVYADWIRRYRIDGFRIDTVRHVNPEFWQAFVPAMRKAADEAGIPHFHIFGEVATDELDPVLLAWHTRVAKLPSVLDFGFFNTVRATVAGTAPTRQLARLFEADALFEGGEAAALRLPTFVSNHDAGRFAHFVHKGLPQADDAEVMQRVVLAHAMLLTLRGVPVLYYGDEQGFAGLGGDQASRHDLFTSQVAEYNADRRVGTTPRSTPASAGSDHPLFKAVAELARLRSSQPALRRGLQRVRAYGDAPGLFAVSRLDPDSGRELLIAFNTSTAAVTDLVQVEAASRRFGSLHGQCAPAVERAGVVRLHVPPLGFVVCGALP
ncbi:MAG: hypothetical protein RL026_2480 [Pseudomonadota bacterium]